jgi:hypothetical protein
VYDDSGTASIVDLLLVVSLDELAAGPLSQRGKRGAA